MSDAEKRTLRRESLAFVCCAENNRFESRHEAAFSDFLRRGLAFHRRCDDLQRLTPRRLKDYHQRACEKANPTK